MSESNAKPTFLSRAQLLEKRPRRFKNIHLPERGAFVRIRSLTAAERGAYEASMYDKKSGTARLDRLAQARERLIIATVVDENDNLMFGPNDAALLAEMDIMDAEAIFVGAQEHNKITDSDVQELVGN